MGHFIFIFLVAVVVYAVIFAATTKAMDGVPKTTLEQQRRLREVQDHAEKEAELARAAGIRPPPFF